MNATQIRTGGERKSMGRWIDSWLGSKAKLAHGRARTRATLSVEGLEGRVVLSGATIMGTTAIQNLASAIVQSSEHLVLQQPQKLSTVISYFESSQELTALLKISGVQTSASPDNFFLQQSLEYFDFANVDYDVAVDLLTQPTSVPSADVASALVTSLDNVVTSFQTGSSDFAIYNEFYKPSQPSAASLHNSTAPQTPQSVDYYSQQNYEQPIVTAMSNFIKTLSSSSKNTTNSASGNTARSLGSTNSQLTFGGVNVGWAIGADAAAVAGAFQNVPSTTNSGF